VSKRVLIVDDENYIRLLLHRTLEELELEGVEIHFAEDGVAGLEAAQALRPELIFLDVMMPRMDGMEVCRRIRRDPNLLGTHIVVLTARGQPPEVEPPDAPHEYLTKPFDPDHIVLRAAEVLGIDLDFEL
jgi:two-component system, OmpR family, alkaline phosphatase synthesis response regulator PhoP